MTAQASKKTGGNGWVYISLILAVALIIVLIWSLSTNKLDGNAVATVNGEKISKQELYDVLVDNAGSDTLDEMIGKVLIKQEMKKAKLSYTQKEVDAEANVIKEQMGGEESFQSALEQYGMSEDYFMEQMETNVQLKKLLADKITVTDDEIKAYFEENKDSLKTAAQVNLQQIVVASKETADEIAKELENKGDFAAIAKAKSTDSSSKDAGGVVGLITKAYLDEAVGEVAFSINLNEVSEPILAEDGSYYLIKVTERQAEKAAVYEEKKDTLKETLINNKLSEQTSTWLNDIKAKSDIVKNIN